MQINGFMNSVRERATHGVIASGGKAPSQNDAHNLTDIPDPDAPKGKGELDEFRMTSDKFNTELKAAAKAAPPWSEVYKQEGSGNSVNDLYHEF